MVTEPRSGGTRASLLSRARGREAAAWRELVELYGPLVAHWCYRRGLDPHATADCVQDVFTAVARSLDRYAPQRSHGAFRSWLWTITANKIRDWQRRDGPLVRPVGGSTHWRQLESISDGANALDEEPTTEQESRRWLDRGLQQVRAEFEPRTWAMFERSVLDQLSTAVVAEEFEVSAATVRQVRSRVLRRLRQQLGDLA